MLLGLMQFTWARVIKVCEFNSRRVGVVVVVVVVVVNHFKIWITYLSFDRFRWYLVNPNIEQSFSSLFLSTLLSLHVPRFGHRPWRQQPPRGPRDCSTTSTASRDISSNSRITSKDAPTVRQQQLQSLIQTPIAGRVACINHHKKGHSCQTTSTTDFTLLSLVQHNKRHNTASPDSRQRPSNASSTPSPNLQQAPSCFITTKGLRRKRLIRRRSHSAGTCIQPRGITLNRPFASDTPPTPRQMIANRIISDVSRRRRRRRDFEWSAPSTPSSSTPSPKLRRKSQKNLKTHRPHNWP